MPHARSSQHITEIDPEWMGWLLEQAQERRLVLRAMFKLGNAWSPGPAERLVELAVVVARVEQTFWMDGLHTRIVLDDATGPVAVLMGAHVSGTTEDIRWPALILEALVLARPTFELAAK